MKEKNPHILEVYRYTYPFVKNYSWHQIDGGKAAFTENSFSKSRKNSRILKIVLTQDQMASLVKSTI